MLPTQLFIVPFFVVGRRMTFTIEIRGRALGDLPYVGDFYVFDYDSHRDRTVFCDSIDMFAAAVKALLSALQERKDAGWPLSHKQEVFLTQKGPDILWLYDVGYGERASVPTVTFDALMDLGD